MVVNAFGNVVEPSGAKTLAGCRESAESLRILDAEQEIRRLTRLRGFPEGQHTVVGAVATNVKLTKTQLTKVAQMAHDGLARVIFPAHTLYDGDTIFALSCGDGPSAEVSIIGALAAQATAQAVVRGVIRARAVSRLPAHGDLS